MADETQSLVDDQKCSLDTSNSDVSMRSLDSYVSTTSSGSGKRRGSRQSESTWETKRACFAEKSAAPSGASSLESVETGSLEDVQEICSVQKSSFGYHEMEIKVHEGADSLPQRCKKTEKHGEFTLFKDLQLHHLPEGYKDELLFQYIKTVGGLVLKLTADFTSVIRPDNYAFSSMRGLNHPRFGSGWVKSAKKKTKNSYGCKKCPCCECSNTNEPKEVWGEVTVCTAKHVIYNTEEVRECKFQLFYDGEDNDDTNVKFLNGCRVLHSDKKKDKTELLCVTHDMDLLTKLIEMCERCEEHLKSLREKFCSSKKEHKFTFVVSHPHGRKKRVSFGKWTKKKSSKDGDVSFCYDAHTCPGSSGAPVCTLDKDWWVVYCDHPHSGVTHGDENTSGFGAS